MIADQYPNGASLMALRQAVRDDDDETGGMLAAAALVDDGQARTELAQMLACLWWRCCELQTLHGSEHTAAELAGLAEAQAAAWRVLRALVGGVEEKARAQGRGGPGGA